ncbi:phosphoribosyl-AMP cyclohydrolase [Spirochaeta thermophila]|uniref:Phosphoribosyl-AMP cyclohydrolase n=1 Tax=Winmispira thermophila (strain ATCC 49972 / DSM 6192 / RI 19.B1) TaxID=665571 RepID=E0RR16_WINT6|nr:phosphoribosyl-AMP cyclohydrolase [Spirochaeta thermophila]ADN01594.1 phosphoribosyl-AMP cyclohydrolase [Spirochaeta thermophila DSM 6192]
MSRWRRLSEEARDLLDFAKMGGLVPVVTQEVHTGEVLMVAFLDPEAWELSLATGYAHYYSRTRRRIWKKGETSGHVQRIVEVRIDCDNDAVLFLVEQERGTACHTGRRSCFYRTLTPRGLAEEEATLPWRGVSPEDQS